MEIFSTSFTLGILGGGQLGKMLLYETRKYDIKTMILDPSAAAPARQGCDDFFQGDLMDFDTVYRFGKQVQVLTVEIEHVNIKALEKLEQEGVLVHPSAKILSIIQDKSVQKQFFEQHEIPTASFVKFDCVDQLKTALYNRVIAMPFVWKSARFGYDGQGVKVVRQFSDLDVLPDTACIAEQYVPFELELAVIVARNPSGEVRSYPVVEMEFHPDANQVEYVLCPARISSEIAQKAIKIAELVAEKFQQVGLLAVEMFLTDNHQILVNEVAPRPHNSGHYTIEASFTSQFEQHLRAILNLPLGETASKAAGVMVNLVGEKGYQGPVVYEGIQDAMRMPGVTPHIYGKKETRPFRKMGHVTIIHNDLSEARKMAQKVKSSIRVITK